MNKLLFFCLTAVSFLVGSLVTANEFSANIDYLYWNAIQSDMTYAVVVNDLNTFAKQDPQNQENDWSSGVRLGIGYDLPCSWDTYFSWTHLYNNTTSKTSKGIIVATQLLSPNTNIIIGGSGVGGPASSKWNLHFNMFDLDFGCTLYDNAVFCIHPVIGLKGGTIHQNEFVRYTNFVDNQTEAVINATSSQRNNFWGIGPKAGFYSGYKLGCGFNLIGDFAIATLFGKHDSSVKTHSVSLGIVSDTKFTYNRHRLFPALQLFIGLDWTKLLCDCYTVSVELGYETQYFWNTWRIHNSTTQDFYVTNAGFGDLMLHGLTARLGMRF